MKKRKNNVKLSYEHFGKTADRNSQDFKARELRNREKTFPGNQKFYRKPTFFGSSYLLDQPLFENAAGDTRMVAPPAEPFHQN